MLLTPKIGVNFIQYSYGALIKQYREKPVGFSLYSVRDSEAIRTLDPRLRRALLYPAELRNQPFLLYGFAPFAFAKIVHYFGYDKSF